MKIVNAILCEDCRIERSGKQILLGIFVGDVLVTQLPAVLIVTFWIQIDGLEVGDHKFEFRTKLDSQVVAGGEFSAGLKFESTMTLPIGPTPIEIPKDGCLRFDIRKAGKRWQHALSKNIRLVDGNQHQ